jgi:hypothetical protein
MQNCTISGFPDPRHPARSEGVEFRDPFMWPFATCFCPAPEGPRLYLLAAYPVTGLATENARATDAMLLSPTQLICPCDTTCMG